jgi:hypothetical protein
LPVGLVLTAPISTMCFPASKPERVSRNSISSGLRALLHAVLGLLGK